MNTLCYIGSKKKLVDTIISTIIDFVSVENTKDKKDLIVADLFAGSGVVSYNLCKQDYFKHVVSNDLEYYAYIINNALLNCAYSTKLEEIIKNLNLMADVSSNVGNQYLTNAYTDNRPFFSNDNGRRIDVARTEIDELFSNNFITKNEHCFLNASIIVSADAVSNTAAVYTSFLKYATPESKKKFVVTPIHRDYKTTENQHVVSNTFAELLNEKYDIAYIDPPYNKRQYGANYFPLNYIAMYNQTIQVVGKTGLIPYKRSDFCSKKKVKQAFDNLIKKTIECGAKFLFISYSNEGILSFDKLKEICDNYGETHVIEMEHKKYQNKFTNDKQVSEFLFCIRIIFEQYS